MLGPDNRPVVTIQQACRLAQVSRRTIYNWIKGDKVEYTRTPGGSIRIFTDSLWKGPTQTAKKTPATEPPDTP